MPRERLRAAEVADARRVLRYSAPLFAFGMAIESASHFFFPGPLLLAITPAVICLVCLGLCWRLFRAPQWPTYPHWVLCFLLLFLLIVVWQHMLFAASLLSAIFSGIAVTACAALIMPMAPAVIAVVASWLGLILSLVVLGEWSPMATFPLPILTLAIGVLIYGTRRRALYLSEHGLLLQEAVDQQEMIAEERTRQLAYVSTIAEGLAHNLSNQLQVQMASLELASFYLDASGDERDKMREHISRAIVASEASTELVAKLQSYAGFAGLNSDSIDVHELCAGLCGPSSNLGGDVHLSLHCRPDLVLVADRSALLSSLRELIRNAVVSAEDAARSAPSVSLVVSEHEIDEINGVAFEVEDNGQGFPEELLASATEPFVTSEPAKRSGLGLSAVSGFAQMHKGRLTVLKSDEDGSTVRLWLPVAAAPLYEL